MRKVSMFLLLGNKNRCLSRKRPLRTKSIRIVAPTGCASDQATYGATLGLYGLRITEFSKLFNRDSVSFFNPGMIITAVLYIYGKSSVMFFQAPTAYYLCKRLFNYRIHWYNLKQLDARKVPVYFLNTYIIALLHSNVLPLCREKECFGITKQVLSQYGSFNLTQVYRISKITHDWKKQRSRNRRKKRKGKVKR